MFLISRSGDLKVINFSTGTELINISKDDLFKFPDSRKGFAIEQNPISP